MRAAILAILAAGLLVTPGFSAAYKPTGKAAAKPASSELTSFKAPDGSLSLEARTIEGNENRLVASGSAHIRTHDSATKTTLDAYAAKIVVAIMKVPKGSKGSPIRSADMTGPVKMVYVTVDPSGVTSKTIATADSADFDGTANVAHLVGNVKITNENPALFSQPAVMCGDRATVNLTPNLGPDGVRFRLESSPGASTITVTPRPKEEQ